MTAPVPEELGPIVPGCTFPFVVIVDMSAQAGLFGGGGPGDVPDTCGVQRYDRPIVYITVATIVVIVRAGQFLGDRPARRALRRWGPRSLGGRGRAGGPASPAVARHTCAPARHGQGAPARLPPTPGPP